VSHVTVLLEEAVAALNIRPNGIYVDATFGRGGHSKLILQKLNQEGRLIALDRDKTAIEFGKTISDPRLQLLHGAFGQLQQQLYKAGINKIDGLLLDLGVSSPQLDEAQRGFSFRGDGPLDMRMDVTSGETAAQWLANTSEQQIAEVIKNYGEERFAKQIAREIIAARSQQPISTTQQLAKIVAKAVRTREPGQDPATRTFQAIRIYLNQELKELSSVLAQSINLLAAAGRLVVISFHSLEDRIVKQFVRDAANPGTELARLPLRAHQLPKPLLNIIGKPIKPSPEEIKLNPRARSAIMRVAERTEAPA
jgi:16S rRNA (cytosine1402-N4)-methyltransferase